MTEDSTITAGQLRGALIDKLRDRGTVPAGPVEAAFRAVPRHLFLPGVPLKKAYADGPVVTKRDGDGLIISTASQPAIMAIMLEQLQVEPGHRVLEIGAGTGYNAGLLGVLVDSDGLIDRSGPIDGSGLVDGSGLAGDGLAGGGGRAGDGGRVTTIDVDEDIVAGARAGLAAAGIQNVQVVLGDGALGWEQDAPYDRVIATVGVWDLPPAWLEQIAPGGRLVVPLRLRGGVSRSVAFERDGDCWRSRSSTMCGFIPLRGIADDARRKVPLTADGSVSLILHQDQVADDGALAGVLDRERSELWTGVQLAGYKPVESLHLWLACELGNSLSLMPMQASAAERGLVQPQSGFGSMAVTDGGDLAYLTGRSVGKVRGQRQQEVGVIGHGAGGERLASAVAEQIRNWDRDYRSRPVQIAIQPAGTAGEPLTGQFVFSRPHGLLAISWT
jgi:protein-L-isoaspartate(D-aspartate) O-methyltransferase